MKIQFYDSQILFFFLKFKCILIKISCRTYFVWISSIFYLIEILN